MLRRRQINADPGGRRLRSSLAAASLPLRDAAGAIEEHVLWRRADLLRAGAEVVRWPFERLAWLVERRLVWPLQERAAGWDAPPRAAGVGALGALAAGLVALALLVLGGDGGGKPIADAPPVPPASPASAPVEREPSGPVLQGVPPKFGVGAGVGVATTSDEQAGGELVDEAVATGGGEAAEEAAATSSSKEPVPAGPAAMKVARRFSEAFVFYEIGKKPERAMTVFGETATPRLATALAERPPRLPEGTEVPKARILNLVPGPRRGKTYTVSASLLRVGVTSELRLELAKRAGSWVVTDVRG